MLGTTRRKALFAGGAAAVLVAGAVTLSPTSSVSPFRTECPGGSAMPVGHVQLAGCWSTTSSSPTSTTPLPGTPAPPGGGGTAWPNESNTGAPANVTAMTSCSGTISTTSPGQIIQDMCIVGDINVRTDNVIIRRVDIRGGRIINWKLNDAGCGANLLVQDTTIAKTAPINGGESSAIELGSYTAERVKILDLAEGFRAAGADHGCTTVTVKDSFIRISPPDVCPNYDWHGDGLQGNGGPPVTIRNSTFQIVYIPNSLCGGTGPFFYPNQGNTSADIDGMLLIGGPYSLRLGMPATVKNVYIQDKGTPAINPDGTGNGYWYGPIDVKCSVVSLWQNVYIATVNSSYVPTAVRAQPCNTEGGN